MGEGKFYVKTIGNGYRPLMMLENSSINTIEDPKEYADDQAYVSQLASFDLIASFGICKSICDCCPNKKVVHLAKHARKRKTRNKNYSRCIRILEKEVKKRSNDIL